MKIKRFNFIAKVRRGKHLYCKAFSKKTGKYVLYSEYEKLEKENTILIKRLIYQYIYSFYPEEKPLTAMDIVQFLEKLKDKTIEEICIEYGF